MLAVPETVIVVDDDAAVRAALKFALEFDGFHVQLYDGPQAVLAAADPAHPYGATLPPTETEAPDALYWAPQYHRAQPGR